MLQQIQTRTKASPIADPLGKPGRRRFVVMSAAKRTDGWIRGAWPGWLGDDTGPRRLSGQVAGGGSSCAENRTSPRGSDRSAQPRRRRWTPQPGQGLGALCRDQAAAPPHVHAQVQDPPPCSEQDPRDGSKPRRSGRL